MKRLLFVWVALCVVLAGCASGTSSNPKSFTVFAASSLTDAFTEIGRNFQDANPDLRVAVNFAGSQILRTQIEAGAGADVFASANPDEMDSLVAAKLVDPTAPQVFLTNDLVVIVPATNPAGLHSLQDLAKPGLKLVLAAGEVPVGDYARQALQKMEAAFGAGFSGKVLANVVSNEDNVKQVVAKVELGEADAGMVYASDAVAAPDVQQLVIPAGMNVVAQYSIAPIVHSTNAEAAMQFVDYVLSPEGQGILNKWGFTPVP